MALLRSEGIVLKTHALGDTSRIVVVYTRDMGMLRFVAKGARKTPGRFGFALEPLSRSRFVFYHKSDRDLQLLSQADTLDPTGSRLTELSRLAHAQAATELVDRLVWGEEPHAELFDLLAHALEAARGRDPARRRDVPDAALPAVPGPPLARAAARAARRRAHGGAPAPAVSPMRRRACPGRFMNGPPLG